MLPGRLAELLDVACALGPLLHPEPADALYRGERSSGYAVHHLPLAIDPERQGRARDLLSCVALSLALVLCMTRGTGCCGWLAVKHPQTFLRNLVELVRPSSIKPSARKKAEEARADMGEDDFEDVAEELNSFTARSTGYFKDLLQVRRGC